MNFGGRELCSFFSDATPFHFALLYFSKRKHFLILTLYLSSSLNAIEAFPPPVRIAKNRILLVFQGTRKRIEAPLQTPHRELWYDRSIFQGLCIYRSHPIINMDGAAC
jgi:hypothetical protein